MIDSYLVVNPNNRILSPYAGIEPCFWAGMIASDLRFKGKHVNILDAEAQDLSFQATIDIIRASKPQHIIFVVMGNNPSVSSTIKMPITKKLIDNLLGEFDIKVAGLHPSALPQQTKMELGVDVLRGKCFDGTPDMPYDLVPMDKYISHFWHNLHDGSARQPYAVTYTSLGCASNCHFCTVVCQYGWQRKVWYRDIDAFIKEVDLLVSKYNVRNIKLYDEHFTTNHIRVNEICDKLIERRYDLNIWAYARVDTVNPKMLDKMWHAGFNWLGYGFESGSDIILAQSGKRASNMQARMAVKWTHEAGINVIGNFIFGLPLDTLETMQTTLDFAKSLNIEFANIYYCENLPGTGIYQNGNKDWSQFGQFSNQKKTEVIKFRNKAFNDYYTDINYLNHIKVRFGEQAVKQIQDMLAFGKPITRGAQNEILDTVSKP